MGARLLPLLLVPVLAGCATDLGSRQLEGHTGYLLREPGTLRLESERLLDEGSWIRGELELTVTEVDWPGEPTADYRMAGTVSGRSRGLFRSALAAREAPREALLAAMEPGNAEEVFEVLQQGGGVTVTKVHWERLGPLELPIEATTEHAATGFSSALLRGSWNSAIELAMVWHKVLAVPLGLPPFGEYRLTATEEGPDRVTLWLRQDLGAGPPIVCRYTLARDGSGLLGLEVEHRDGTRSVLRRVPAEPGPR